MGEGPFQNEELVLSMRDLCSGLQSTPAIGLSPLYYHAAIPSSSHSMCSLRIIKEFIVIWNQAKVFQGNGSHICIISIPVLHWICQFGLENGSSGLQAYVELGFSPLHMSFIILFVQFSVCKVPI